MFDYSPLRYLNEKYVTFAEQGPQVSFLPEKWGVQDLEGNIIIPAIFNKVSDADRPNRFIVRQNEKEGVIDEHMKWIIPCEYSSLYCYEPRNAYVAYDQKPRRKRIGGMLDTEGKVILPFLYEHVFPSPTEDMITVKRRGRWMVINSKNEKLFDIGK